MIVSSIVTNVDKGTKTKRIRCTAQSNFADISLMLYISIVSVPARLGKGQGAKEIGRNLARERPKFGHNLVRKRHKIFYATQNLLRVNDQNLVLWAIDENMGTNLQAFYKHFYISCLKTQKQQLHFVKIKNSFIFFSFKLIFFLIIREGACKSGRAQASTGRAQHPQK